jgi:hypothetical protein
LGLGVRGSGAEAERKRYCASKGSAAHRSHLP